MIDLLRWWIARQWMRGETYVALIFLGPLLPALMAGASGGHFLRDFARVYEAGVLFWAALCGLRLLAWVIGRISSRRQARKARSGCG